MSNHEYDAPGPNPDPIPPCPLTIEEQAAYEDWLRRAAPLPVLPLEIHFAVSGRWAWSPVWAETHGPPIVLN